LKGKPVVLDTVCAAIGRYLDSRRQDQVEFLAELVRVPSDNPPGDCAPLAARAAELLEGLGFAVERDPVPEAECRAHGMISATNLIVRRRFGPGPTIALNAHGDVVAPGEGWSSDPYGAEIRGGRIYGRGVAVSKSDFATYAYALRALEESGAPLAGTVELHLTCDEEAGERSGPSGCSIAVSASRIWRSGPASPMRWSLPTTAVCIWRSWSSAARPTPPCPIRGATPSRPPPASSPHFTPSGRTMPP